MKPSVQLTDKLVDREDTRWDKNPLETLAQRFPHEVGRALARKNDRRLPKVGVFDVHLGDDRLDDILRGVYNDCPTHGCFAVTSRTSERSTYARNPRIERRG
jgi:hypothetical protein